MRYAKAYWETEDTTFYWEFDDSGVVTRQIEIIQAEQRYIAAASTAELLEAISRGTHQAYQETYGATADQPLQEWDPDAPLEWIAKTTFEAQWVAARATIGQP